MKVFYRKVQDPVQTLNKYGTKIEELHMPASTLKTLEAELATSTNILPPSARSFNDGSITWEIGLIER